MSGTYQSRVFTFISKRTNRLKDTCAQGFRQIRVAVVWSGQILLYPIQLLAQKTKIFQPQLKSPPQPKSLPEPVSDINIEQALNLVIEAGYPIVIAECGSLTVAEDRARNPASRSKGAIFVQEDTSNLGQYDPDTDDWEVASYSPRRSSQVVAKKPVVRGLSSLLIDRQLVLVTTANELLDILTISQQQEIRRRIGVDLAIDWHQWHTGELLDHHDHQQLSANRDLFLTDETSIQQLAIVGSETNSSSSPTLLDRWANWLQSFKLQSPDETISTIPEITTEIVPTKSPQQLAPAQYSFTPQPPQTNRYLDLPQLPPISEDAVTSDRKLPILANISNLQPDWLKQWWKYYRDYLYIPSDHDSQIVHQPAEFQLIPLTTKSAKHKSKQHSTIESNQNSIDLFANSSSNPSIEFDPDLDSEYYHDWIEVDSELIGYKKSLLTKLLEWLDRIILYIENWLIKIWNMIINKSAES
jgi:hypothetical protein